MPITDEQLVERAVREFEEDGIIWSDTWIALTQRGLDPTTIEEIIQ